MCLCPINQDTKLQTSLPGDSTKAACHIVESCPRNTNIHGPLFFLRQGPIVSQTGLEVAM